MKIISEKEFEEEIKSGLVLVDFFATWCAPCRMMAMILEEFEQENKDLVKIVKVDVDQSETLARKFGVMSIPTMIIFKDGQEQNKHIGLMQKSALKEFVEAHK